MNEVHRQSGRTTRTIEEACKAAYVGRAVYLFAHSPSDARYLERRVDAFWEKMAPAGMAHGIKVENMAHWDHHGQWNWHEMQPTSKGHHPNCLFLVDHYTVEVKLEQVQHDIKYLATLAGKLYPHTV